MPILQKILTWSQGLPAWQSDAIARLFIKGTPSDTDWNDLFALLKTEHGIADPKGRKANRLNANLTLSANGGYLTGYGNLSKSNSRHW